MDAQVDQIGTQDSAQPALTLAQLAQRLMREQDRFVLHGAGGWMQGRTMYGGASSYIAYLAATRAFPDLPPLRAAQIGFIGPVGEDVEARVAMLRTGKSVSHVETTLWCEGALVHRTTWLFGRARDGNGAVPAGRLDALPPPEACEVVPPRLNVPGFTERMELRYAGPPETARLPVVRRWVRLRDRDMLDPIAELIAIGDALPPGSIRAMERRGPISSINWSLTVLGTDFATRDGWWLLETASNHMADGFSSETLGLWNTDGVEVMRGLQAVAIFG
jgi:acyl-CoA thioesterase